jgi:hypothetical protein
MGSELTAMEFPGLVAVSILVCLTRGGAKDFIPSFFSIFLLADQGEALLSRFRKERERSKHPILRFSLSRSLSYSSKRKIVISIG